MDKEQGFIYHIEKSIVEHWDQDALTDYQGLTFRYCDVARQIAKLHIGMQMLGLQPGDRIAICGRNSASWTVAYFSIITYGCVAVPIQTDFKPEQIHNIVNHSESKFLYVGDGVAPTIDFEQMPNIAGIAYLNDLTIRHYRTARLLAVRNHLNEYFDERYPKRFCREHVKYYREKSMDDLAIMNYTSGTTGHSKGVMIPYRSMLNNLEFTQTILGRGAKSGDDLVSTLPMGHTFGMTCEMVFSMVRGLHLHFLNRQPSPSLIMQMCQEIKPCMLMCVPLVVDKIVRQERANAKKALGGKLYQVFTGGAPLNLEVEEYLMSIKFPITIGYGCTETGPMITFSDWHEHKMGSCGTAVPGMQLRILNPDAQGCGELMTRGDSTMLGYYKNPEATAEVLDKDGWFHTGDFARIDSEGYVYIMGRIKNMLLGANGQNIYPEEIEDKLNNMPGVAESIVVQNGTQLVALVYPVIEDGAPDSGELTIEEQMDLNRKALNDILPSYCRVSEIRLVNQEFEKTAKKSIKRYLYKL